MFELGYELCASKDEYYENLLLNVKGLIDDEKDAIANMANVSALIFHTMQKINWVGFYLFKNDELVLGPFQGKPACIRIQIGKGVCGTAAQHKTAQVIKDVHQFKGHIACDSASNSEIVIPMLLKGQLVGVLDIDSPIIARFDDKDRQNLEELIEYFMNQCSWDGYK